MAKTQAKETLKVQEQQVTPMDFDVRIYPVKTEGALKANATVNINSFFAVTNIRIMNGTKGPFVSMPRYKGRNGEFKDICFPCTKEAKAAFDSAILTAYEQTMSQQKSDTQKCDSPKKEAPEQASPQMATM